MERFDQSSHHLPALQNPYFSCGGRKSKVAGLLDEMLNARGWIEKSFNTRVVVDGRERDSPTHKVDCFKNKVAIEIEWNNKDPFFDRDLNNFRLLFDLRQSALGSLLRDVMNSKEYSMSWDEAIRSARPQPI